MPSDRERFMDMFKVRCIREINSKYPDTTVDKLFCVWVFNVVHGTKGFFKEPNTDIYYEVTMDSSDSSIEVNRYQKF